MGRKPKVVETAAPQPEVKVPNGPTPDRIAEVLADYTTLETGASRIRQEIKTLLDNFEKEGGHKAELKDLHKSLKLDPREAQAKLERRIRYHAGQGIQVSWAANGQADVLAELGPEAKGPDKTSLGAQKLAAAQAHSRGFNDGLAGAVPADNPFQHAPGSEEYVQWHDGRDDGQRTREEKNPALRDRIASAAVADASLPVAATAEDRPIF